MVPMIASFLLSILLNTFITPGFGGDGSSSAPNKGNNSPANASAAVPDEPYYTIVPQVYCCLKTSGLMTVDGKMDESAWKDAPWTNDFVDIEGSIRPRPLYRTRVKMLWDQRYLYFFAEMEDPHVWGTLTQRDAVIFHDNDFEIFIGPSGNNHTYYEFEMNALNTVWDLYLPKPYRDGGPADNSWDINGLLSAVQVHGTLNNPADVDQGWTAEIAIPWASFNRHGELRGPVFEGKTWRINFSRVQWQHDASSGSYEKIPGTSENNWVWSPQGVVDMHRPEKWGWVRFIDQKAKCAELKADKHYHYTMALHRVYWAQKEFLKTHKRWAKNFSELGITADSMRIEEWLPELTPTHNGWKAEYNVLSDERMDSRTWVILGIDQDSKLSRAIGFDKLTK